MEETDADDNLEEAYLVEFPSPPITEFLGCDFKLIPQIYPEMRRMVVEFREPDCEDGDEEGSTLEINEDKEEYLLLESNAPADLGEAEMTQMAEQSEHGEQQSRNAESMETVQIDSVRKVKNLGPKLEAESVRGHGGTIELEDESLRTNVRRMHWKRCQARPRAHGEKMLRMLRKGDEFYEFSDDKTAVEGDYDWERYDTAIEEDALNQNCLAEESSKMQDLADEQQWQEAEKSIRGEQKHSYGRKGAIDVTLEAKQARGEKEQSTVGNEDGMSGLKYRFFIPKMVGSQPMTDTRWRKQKRSTDCSEQSDEEKVLRRDNELKICGDGAQWQFNVEEKPEELEYWTGNEEEDGYETATEEECWERCGTK